jgi:hypothetical protein
MADTITDNRTLISNADSVPGSAPYWVDISANVMASGNLDTEIFIEGTGSIGEVAGSTRAGIFWEYATTQNLANNHIYFWLNCGVVGLLNTKAAQGMTFRIYTTDPTTDYAEWDIGGSDSWPNSVQGGWTLFVIDLESTPSRTSGTAPSTSAVLGLGVSFQTPTMPRMVNNVWMDGLYSLADGNPAVIVEGKNGGTTPWTWADLPTQLGVASGVAQEGPGGAVVLNGPVQFFVDDATDHEFASANETVLWGSQEYVASDFYGITVLGAGTGTADFKMGIKSGTGNDATGAQGGSIIAGSADVRWFFDGNAANIDTLNMYGVQCIHGATFDIDTTSNSWISCAFVDCDKANVSNAEILDCSVIDANTADGTAFMVTDDIGDIVKTSFQFSDGHAIEITDNLTGSQNNVGNLFSGYTNSADSTDAAVYLSEAGNPDLTISSSDGSNLGTNSWRTLGTGTITINNTQTLNVQVNDEDSNGMEDVFVSIRNASTNALISEGRTNASGLYSDPGYNYGGDVSVNVYIRRSSPGYKRYVPAIAAGTITSTGLNVTQKMTPDPNVALTPVSDFRIARTGLVSNDVSGTTITAQVKIPESTTGSRKIVAAFGFRGGASQTISGTPTFNGQNMSLYATEITQTDERMWGYYYDVPNALAAGVYTMSVTFSGAVPERSILYAIYNKAATGAPDATATDDGSSVTTDPTFTLVPTNTNNIEAVFCLSDDLTAPVEGGTGSDVRILRADEFVGGAWQGIAALNNQATAASHTVILDLSTASKQYAGVAASISEA